MLVNLCIVMRIVLSEVDYQVVHNISLLPCSDNWEPHSAISQKAPRNARHDQYFTQDAQGYDLKSLFGYKLHEGNDIDDLRLRVKSPVYKVANIWAKRLESYVRNYFEPLPRRFKPVTIIQLRNKERNDPNMGATNPDLVKLPAPYYYTSSAALRTGNIRK